MSRLTPYIREVGYSNDELKRLRAEIQKGSGSKRNREHQVLFRFPTVYVVHDQPDNNQDQPEYTVYIGETSDIATRTNQHLTVDPKTREDWHGLANSGTSKMFIIGHEHFNKSLTLDIENRLMTYMLGVNSVKNLNNRRTNQQLDYYTREEFDEIFTRVWRGLRNKDKKLFPAESIVRDSALFKASPFHKLSEEQLCAKREIHDAIQDALATNKRGQLIVVSGEAGAGKTVLLSSLFFELFQNENNEDDPSAFQDLDAYMLINHDEQVTIYQNIAKRLGVLDKGKTRVSKPTKFINDRDVVDDKEKLADVVLVDEAHLLWTQGKQSYRGKNQLNDLLDRARAVVVVFDKNQIMAANQYWEEHEFEQLKANAAASIHLTNQMRMDAEPETVRWVRTLVDLGNIEPIPADDKYDLQVFDDPTKMWKSVKKASEKTEQGLSRVLATFDWAYSSTPKGTNGETWNVEIGDFSLPWNREIPLDSADRRKAKNLSWAEQEHTINEVGSTFTIQGSDLNYAGVILGPSVKWRDGHVVVDPSASKNKAATNKRTLADGSKVTVSEDLLKNEINVLLTRGVHGLYIYAVDEPLRAELLRAQEVRNRKKAALEKK